MWLTYCGVALGIAIACGIRPYLRWEARMQDRALARDLGQDRG